MSNDVTNADILAQNVVAKIISKYKPYAQINKEMVLSQKKKKKLTIKIVSQIFSWHPGFYGNKNHLFMSQLSQPFVSAVFTVIAFSQDCATHLLVYGVSTYYFTTHLCQWVRVVVSCFLFPHPGFDQDVEFFLFPLLIDLFKDVLQICWTVLGVSIFLKADKTATFRKIPFGFNT